MDPKPNPNNENKPGQPQKPKGNIWTTMLITLAIVLIFTLIYNNVKKSQYTETTFTDFMTT